MKHFSPSGFFVMRAPLLPLEELDRLRTDSEYWRSLVDMPEVYEALYLASPGLMSRVAAGTVEGKVVEALTSYLVRMCTRATPLGLFASCSTGVVGEATALVVDGPEGTVRHTRPDAEVLAALIARLLADPETRSKMVVEPNPSRYRAAGTLRIVASRMRNGRRSHHLVAVEEDAALCCSLDAASGGATIEQVKHAVHTHTGFAYDEIASYIDALLDAQVLTPVAEPPVTGPLPLAHVISSLGGQGFNEAAATLGAVSDDLAALDAAGLGRAPLAYAALSTTLRELAGDGDASRLFMVDLHRVGSGLTLGGDVLRQLVHGIDLLHRLSSAAGNTPLARFKEAFCERYEEREVPLMQALDEEMGIGFEVPMHPAADASTLLAGIDFGGRPPPGLFTARDAVLLDLLTRSRDAEASSVELDPQTIERLNPEPTLPLPDALAAVATVLDDGVEIQRVYGPSGVQLLGRFCHGDQRLHAAVTAHLRAEEARAPGVVFAELVHLPDSRTGNVLTRPLLRDHELVLLGRSGAPEDRQLRLEELTLRFDDNRLILYSPRLDAEVRPRLSNAHNVYWGGLGLYRFLAALQRDGVAGELGWDWGALSGAPYLPRVTAGRLVLSRASWRLSAHELATVTGRDAAAGWAELAVKRGLPSEVSIVDGDMRLYIDTSSPLLTAAAAKVLRGRTEALLEEVLPSRVAVGPGGRYAHELVVPFVRTAGDSVQPHSSKRLSPTTVRRSFGPGSEWLYLKIYTGTASADHILNTVCARADDLRAAGVVDRWFFLRYRDPHHHLRLRLHGEPAALGEHALPMLTEALAPRVDDGTVWNIEVGTYRREIERYGGDTGIALAEKIHGADSYAVWQVLGMLEGDVGLDVRWKICLYAIDRLLTDAGLDIAQRLEWARVGAARYRREYPHAPKLETGIAGRWRSERADLTALLDETCDHPYDAARQVFRSRSDLTAPLLAELGERQRRGMLTVPLPQLLGSFNHLHANRLLRSAGLAHELVLLGFLDRHYTSHLGRRSVPQAGANPRPG